VLPGLHLVEHLAGEPGRLADVLWLGSGRAVEARALASLADRAAPAPTEHAALPLEPSGGGAPSRAGLALRTPRALLAARAALRRHRSDVLIGLGGFPCLPAVPAARSLGVPVCLLEINAVPGAATRRLAPLAARVAHAFEASVPRGGGRRHVVTGAPLSAAFAEPDTSPEARARARRALGIEPGGALLVVLGGSQGAGGLNRFVAGAADELRAAGVSVLHQVGPGRLEEGAAEGPGYRGVEFVDDVAAALVAADLVLTRGGASTLAEVAAVGTPALVVPYPHHADRHQERNARAVGLEVVDEAELGPDVLARIVGLCAPEARAERALLSARLRAGSRTDGAATLAGELLDLARTRK
jgi:UDP-N-acetylglucosamine--N-acetylmuramyl-(pentapeptide) pyrophosphoryl-undecaprenol N-acetylglucosamine transferase